MKGRDAIAVSGDSRIEVEFNPNRVASYRLIGYDRQPSPPQDLNEGKVGSDRIGTGYTLTAFYEAVLLGQGGATADTRIPSDAGQPAERLLSAKLQFRMLGNAAVRSIERVLTDTQATFAAAPQDLKFAAAVVVSARRELLAWVFWRACFVHP